MFDVNKDHCLSIEQRLLYNIFKLLKENYGLKEENINPVKAGFENTKDNPNIQICKYCGKTHDNKGQALACAKKHKKGSV